MSCKNAEVFLLILGFYLPVVDSCHSLNKIHHPSSIIRRRFVDELVIHKRPDALILMHMGADVHVHKAFSVDLSR